MGQASIWKGIAAGSAGGLVASWCMGQAHQWIIKAVSALEEDSQSSAPEDLTVEDPTAKVARQVASHLGHRSLSQATAKSAGVAVHYLFGSSMAAFYGVLAECWPSIAGGEGLPFGFSVWLGAHVIALPVLGLAPAVTRSAPSSELAELLSHLVYGGVTELVRSRTRRLLVRSGTSTATPVQPS